MRLRVSPLARGRIRFAVHDDGPGIPATSASACSSASTAPTPPRDRRPGGAGLGLAIVRAIAEAHEGTVRVAESQNGYGAAVELVLPGFDPT